MRQFRHSVAQAQSSIIFRDVFLRPWSKIFSLRRRPFCRVSISVNNFTREFCVSWKSNKYVLHCQCTTRANSSSCAIQTLLPLATFPRLPPPEQGIARILSPLTPPLHKFSTAPHKRRRFVFSGSIARRDSGDSAFLSLFSNYR